MIDLPKEPGPEPVVALKNAESQHQKKSTIPSCLIRKSKQTYYTFEVNAIKLNGGMVILNVVKADGSFAYKADINTEILGEKTSTDELNAMKVVHPKLAHTADSEKVTVEKRIFIRIM